MIIQEVVLVLSTEHARTAAGNAALRSAQNWDKQGFRWHFQGCALSVRTREPTIQNLLAIAHQRHAGRLLCSPGSPGYPSWGT